MKMEVSSQENTECVLMPWDDETTIIVSEGDNTHQAYSRWDLIQKQLRSSQISNPEELVNVIKSYNVVFAKNGQQEKSSWKFHILFQYFAQLDEPERKEFFEENGVISTIKNLSLLLKEFVPSLKLLKTGFSSSVQLHQIQISSILSNAFFCTFPKGKADCPSINFNTLYQGPYKSDSKYYIEKLKCLMHYFKRIHKKQPSGSLTFHRLHIPDHKFPRWDKTTADLCSLRVDAKEKIEDQNGYLQMDFANKYVGGGVLGRGCVQEEIRFLISPELISARLFTECLADNESIFVIGAERYCLYRGYSKTFAFAGDYEDTSPFDENGHRKTYLIILDALYFHRTSDQYRESKILRELKKAYVGFKPLEKFKSLPLATGNWGCGVYGGDPQLKSLIQLMASSQACRNILYLTFGNFQLKDQIEEFYSVLKKKAVNVGMLYRIIRLYNSQKKSNQTVFEFVLAAINQWEDEKSPFTSTPPSSGRPSTTYETDYSSLTDATKVKRKVEKRHIEETSIDFPEMNLDFEALDKTVEQESKNINLGRCPPITHSNQPLNQQNSEQQPEIPSLLDVILCENKTDSSDIAKEGREEKPGGTKNWGDSPTFFSGDETEVTYQNTGNLPGAEGASSLSGRYQNRPFESPNRIRNESLRKGQYKKLVQPKITDCFKK